MKNINVNVLIKVCNDGECFLYVDGKLKCKWLVDDVIKFIKKFGKYDIIDWSVNSVIIDLNNKIK